MNPDFPQTESPIDKPAQDFQAVGPALRIFQLNVEGLTAAKRKLIAVSAKENNIDVICLQETHIGADESRHFTITGYDVISYALHNKHGRAMYVRNDIVDVVKVESARHWDVIAVGGYMVANVYKPPSEKWEAVCLPNLTHPAIATGDFNSHHQNWGYETEDADGVTLINWASQSDFHLVHDPKQRGTFRSARWKKEYNPDLCWVSTKQGQPQPASCVVLNDFPKSQHRPSVIHVGLQIPIIRSIQKPRWNFRKANWDKFAEKLDRSVVTIPLTAIDCACG